MRTVRVTCIRCPMGCAMDVAVYADGAAGVEGASCKRGKRYARSEAVNPTRIVTGTICVPGVLEPLSYKTSGPVSRDMVREVAATAQRLAVRLPVAMGDVICDDICGTGVSLIATKGIGWGRPEAAQPGSI